jgi:hypothetical protein
MKCSADTAAANRQRETPRQENVPNDVLQVAQQDQEGLNHK